MASGAKILILDDCVIKVNGGDRIDRQAEWLESHQADGIVKILGHWHGGYAMEKLDAPGILPTPPLIISLLERYVWKPTTWNCDWNNVIRYAHDRSEEWWPEITGELRAGLLRCAEANLTIVETHGDPTAENVMLRGENLVLIDPIPPEDHLPSLLALDLGKILQSWCGYESVIVGRNPNFRRDTSWMYKFLEQDRAAAKVFALYHIVRLLPYLPNDEVRENVKEIVGKNVRSLDL